MERKKLIKLAVFIATTIFVAMQFARPDRTVSEIAPQLDIVQMHNAPEDIQLLLKSSCYDCHSIESKYPWHSQIAPVSWGVQMHINEGREHLNFSEWGNYPKNKRKHMLEACYKELAENEMPLKSYTWMHQEAALTAISKNKLLEWFKEENNHLLEYFLGENLKINVCKKF